MNDELQVFQYCQMMDVRMVMQGNEPGGCWQMSAGYWTLATPARSLKDWTMMRK